MGQNVRGMLRLLAGVLLGMWLGVAFAITLREAHPLAGQVVNDNSTPFVTIRIYLANLDSAFWLSQWIGNLLLLLPVGLLGPIALPWLNRWWRVLLVALVLSGCIETAQLWIPDRSADVDDVMLNALGALLGYWLLLLIRMRPSTGEPLLGPD
jgi:glycopeptide antibiotics resistance protein